MDKICLPLVLIAALFAGCRRQQEQKYELYTLQIAPFRVEVSGRCELLSENVYQLRVPSSPDRFYPGERKIGSLLEEGVRVEKGQVIAEISAPEMDRKMRQWESEEKIAHSDLEGAEKKLKLEQSRLEKEIADIEHQMRIKELDLKLARLAPSAIKSLEAERAIVEARLECRQKCEDADAYRQLFEKKSVAEFEFFKRQNEWQQAGLRVKEKILERKILERGADPLELARLDHAWRKETVRLQQAQNDLKYQLVSLQAEVERARQNLSDVQQTLGSARDFQERLKLQAPAAGVVVYERVWSDSGMEKCKPGIAVWSGYPIVSVHDVAQMQVLVEIAETQITLVRDGQKATVRIDSIKDREFDGMVTSVGNLAHSKREGDGFSQDSTKEMYRENVFEVGVRLTQDDPRIRPGLTGNVTILVREIPEALAVPLSAIFAENGKTMVYLQQEHGPLAREVRVGAHTAKQALVEDGLRCGDEVWLESLPSSSQSARLFQVPWKNGQRLELTECARARRGVLQEKISLSGLLAPIMSHMLTAPLSGRLVQILPEGSAVRRGDKVFTVEKKDQSTLEDLILQKQNAEFAVKKQQSELARVTVEQELKVQVAELEVKSAQFELSFLESQPFPEEVKLAATRSELAALAHRLAEKALAVGVELRKRQSISDVEMGQRRLEVESTKAQLAIARLKQQVLGKGAGHDKIAMAREKLQLSRLKLQQTQKTAESIRGQAQASLKLAQVQAAKQDYLLEFERSSRLHGEVLAPADGVLRYHRDWWLGGKPEIGMDCNRGMRLATVSEEKNLVVECKVNEVERCRVREGQSAAVSLPAFPEKKLTGRVTSVSRVATDRDESDFSFVSTQSQSGIMVFGLKVEILDSDGELRPGMSAEAEIVVATHENVVIVPRECVVTREDGQCLFLLRHDQPQAVPVTLGPANETEVVVGEEVKEGDRCCRPLREIAPGEADDV